MFLQTFFKHPQVKKWLLTWTPSYDIKTKDNPRVKFRINVVRRSVAPFWTNISYRTWNWQTPLLNYFDDAKWTNLSESDVFGEEAQASSNFCQRKIFKGSTEKMGFYTSKHFLPLMGHGINLGLGKGESFKDHMSKLRGNVVILGTGNTAFETGSSIASEGPKSTPLKTSDPKLFCEGKSTIEIDQVDISPEEVRIKFLNAFGLASYPSKNSPAMCRRAFEPGWGFLMTKAVVLNQMWVSFTVDISFYVKLMPNITNIMQMAKGVNENGANGVTVINMISSESVESAHQFHLGASLIQVRFSARNQNDSAICDYCHGWERGPVKSIELLLSANPQVGEAQSFPKEQEHNRPPAAVTASPCAPSLTDLVPDETPHEMDSGLS
ncbi:hypothetical protein KR074_010319 [Drosophila pseudoananassae]|nr:hypothetical protein KR074_010319 [Drosophila pseudoananassae]